MLCTGLGATFCVTTPSRYSRAGFSSGSARNSSSVRPCRTIAMVSLSVVGLATSYSLSETLVGARGARAAAEGQAGSARALERSAAQRSAAVLGAAVADAVEEVARARQDGRDLGVVLWG